MGGEERTVLLGDSLRPQVLLYGDGIICPTLDPFPMMSISCTSEMAEYVRAIIDNYHT